MRQGLCRECGRERDRLDVQLCARCRAGQKQRTLTYNGAAEIPPAIRKFVDALLAELDRANLNRAPE